MNETCYLTENMTDLYLSKQNIRLKIKRIKKDYTVEWSINEGSVLTRQSHVDALPK